MTTYTLKNLYKTLVEERMGSPTLPEPREWHREYRHIFQTVQDIKKRIKKGKKLNPEDDKAFLELLIYTDSNGIGSKGRSYISKDNFNVVIKDKDFLHTLEKVICEPTNEHYKKLGNTWSRIIEQNNPLIINRIVAACTHDVSTKVYEEYFNTTFNWLIVEKLIPNYPTEKENNWFLKNVFLMKQLKETFKEELQNKKIDNNTNQEFDELYLSQFVWYLYQYISGDYQAPAENIFNKKKQLVYYGVPGTGKTYIAKLNAQKHLSFWHEEIASLSPSTKAEYPQVKNTFTEQKNIELIQFHPSYSYEDFIEGMRPIMDENKQVQLTLQNGTFKTFCMRAAKWEIDINRLYNNTDKDNTKKENKNEALSPDKWESLTVEDILPFRENLLQRGHYWEYIFNINDTSLLLSEVIPPFFFIIDEINRAELSRVFGELMYCLEYRGIKNAIKTQYAHLNTKDTGMLCTDTKQNTYAFFIPTNVYVIGTMNTTDRSVESFDFALRRRFAWYEINPDTNILKNELLKVNEAWCSLADRLKNLNAAISDTPLLGKDYQIGHAYLMNLRDDQGLSEEELSEKIWGESILPLLQEYLRGAGEIEQNINALKETFVIR